jgi:hypothetical protein
MAFTMASGRTGSKRLVVMLAVAGTIALLVIATGGGARSSASGATSGSEPTSPGVRPPFDAWYNDPEAQSPTTARGYDAWFNDPAETSKVVSRLDAWYLDLPSPSDPAMSGPAPFDAWFNDR